MRKLVRKIVEILDGTPASYGKDRSRGQSVVEMTLVTPLLIILIIGIVEIGWYASNYLTLLEVTRLGARRGAVLQGDYSPLNWNETLSYHPDLPFTDPNWPNPDRGEGWCAEGEDDANCDFWKQSQWEGDAYVTGVARQRYDVRQCPPPTNTYVGFYNLILCQMLQSMDPLEIKYGDDIPDEERIDDVIISVFSVQMVDNRETVAVFGEGGDIPLLVDGSSPRYVPVSQPINDTGGFYDEYWRGGNQTHIPVVVGRFPNRANECNVYRRVDNPDTVVGPITELERDPFDYINNEISPDVAWVYDTGAVIIDKNQKTHTAPGDLIDTYPLELAIREGGAWVSTGYDTDLEMQRGFSYTGYHQLSSTPVVLDDGNQYTVFCYGSEWTIYDIQELMRNQGFQMSPGEIQQIRSEVDPDFGKDCDESGFCVDEDVSEFYTNQGVILVEIYWQHHLLLDFPVFSPVYQALGDDQKTIYVYSAFPVAAAAPNIDYQRCQILLQDTGKTGCTWDYDVVEGYE
jgi:hypothetical protein